MAAVALISAFVIAPSTISPPPTVLTPGVAVTPVSPLPLPTNEAAVTVPVVTTFCTPKLGLTLLPAMAAVALMSAFVMAPSIISPDPTLFGPVVIDNISTCSSSRAACVLVASRLVLGTTVWLEALVGWNFHTCPFHTSECPTAGATESSGNLLSLVTTKESNRPSTSPAEAVVMVISSAAFVSPVLVIV